MQIFPRNSFVCSERLMRIKLQIYYSLLFRVNLICFHLRRTEKWNKRIESFALFKLYTTIHISRNSLSLTCKIDFLTFFIPSWWVDFKQIKSTKVLLYFCNAKFWLHAKYFNWKNLYSIWDNNEHYFWAAISKTFVNFMNYLQFCFIIDSKDSSNIVSKF